jgi:hypothetical protein
MAKASSGTPWADLGAALLAVFFAAFLGAAFGIGKM